MVSHISVLFMGKSRFGKSIKIGFLEQSAAIALVILDNFMVQAVTLRYALDAEGSSGSAIVISMRVSYGD